MNDRAPDLIDPVVGWRIWRVVMTAGGARLESLTRDVCWPVGEPLVADCTALPSIRHTAPWPTCRCGIYAARNGAGIADELLRVSLADRHLAVGRVALWGQVREGEHGFRASHARPVQLALLSPPRAPSAERIDVAFGLADYGVPVTLVDQPRVAVIDELRLDAFDIGPLAVRLA